jgi:hypothetical protein
VIVVVIYSICTFRDAQAFVDRVFNNCEDHDIVGIYSELFKGVQKDIVDDNHIDSTILSEPPKLEVTMMHHMIRIYQVFLVADMYHDFQVKVSLILMK